MRTAAPTAGAPFFLYVFLQHPNQTFRLPLQLVDDFVRNFLLRQGMTRTLTCFQTEWYELVQKGQLQEDNAEAVPDIYIRNQQVGLLMLPRLLRLLLFLFLSFSLSLSLALSWPP